PRADATGLAEQARAGIVRDTAHEARPGHPTARQQRTAGPGRGYATSGQRPYLARDVARCRDGGSQQCLTRDSMGRHRQTAGPDHDAGRHAVDAFTEADVKAFESVGKVLGRGGTLVEVALAANDYMNGAGLGTTVGKTGGSVAGTWLGATGGGAAFGSAFGPEGAFVGAILGAAI